MTIVERYILSIFIALIAIVFILFMFGSVNENGNLLAAGLVILILAIAFIFIAEILTFGGIR